MQARQVYLEKPHHSYGPEFVRIFAQDHGLRTVANYPDRRDALLNAPNFPVLLSQDVIQSLHAPAGRLESLIEYLRRDFDVVAAVPHNQIVLSNAVRINDELGNSQFDSAIMHRFSDKEQFKAHLRAVDPELDISATVIVASPSQVRDAMARYDYQRVVLKPADGWGNVDVGFFDSDSTDQELGTYFDKVGGQSVVLEEFYEGREFYTCGQVDAAGNVTTFALFETVKGSANGRTNIDFEVRLTHTDDEAFGPLVAFSERVVKASGLTRSPFHVDLILDPQGRPRLIEMGGRIVGDSRAYDMNIVHGRHLNVFKVAAHYYVDDSDFGDVGLDWDHYNSYAYRSVQGINSIAQRLFNLGGVATVESMPEFVRWAHKPVIGDPLPVTVDLLSAPWQVVLRNSDEEALDRTTQKVRRSLVINQVSGAFRRQALKARALVPGFRRQARLRTSPLQLVDIEADSALPAD